MTQSIRNAICGKHATIYTDKGCVACRLVKFRNDNTQLHRLLAFVMLQAPAEDMSTNVDACIQTIQDMKTKIQELETEIEFLKELSL